MANEITASCQLLVNNPTANIIIQGATYENKVTMSGTHVHRTVQDIGTTYELIVIPAEVATLGWARFTNCDATNYVELGVEVSSAFYGFVKLRPGRTCLVPLAMGRTALFGRANTGGVKLDIEIVEE